MRIALKFLEEGELKAPMNIYMPCNMILDVNMEFTRKSWYVATGCHTPKYDDIRYAGIVSHDIFRIDFNYAALNGINIMSADIKNDYLKAPWYENYWTIYGPEFGSEHEGKKAIIFELSMDFHTQERISEAFFTIVWSILDLSHNLMNRMYGFTQLSIVTVILTTGICFCTLMTDFASVITEK